VVHDGTVVLQLTVVRVVRALSELSGLAAHVHSPQPILVRLNLQEWQ